MNMSPWRCHGNASHEQPQLQVHSTGTHTARAQLVSPERSFAPAAAKSLPRFTAKGTSSDDAQIGMAAHKR